MGIGMFQNTEGYATRLAALKEIKLSWERREYVAKGTWANVGKELNYAVADACAEALNSL
jgi:hypothetical protein